MLPFFPVYAAGQGSMYAHVPTRVARSKIQMPSLVSFYLTPLKQGLPLNLESSPV